MTSPNCPNPSSSYDPDEWEICNDDGFVYKRRRRAHQPPAAALYADVDADLRRHRIARKKKSLLSLKEKYSQEFNRWEALSSSFPSSSSSAPAEVGPTPSSAPAAAPVPFPAPSEHPEIDELLLQAEAQEAVLRKLAEMCDYVESVCDAEEERFVKELMDLPIWGSPKRLMNCLQSQ